MTLLRWIDIESENFQINVVEKQKYYKVKANGNFNYRATLFALVRLVCDYSLDSSYKIVMDFEETKLNFTNDEITGLINYIKHLQTFYSNRFSLILPRKHSDMATLIISRFNKEDVRMDYLQGSKNLNHWLKNTSEIK
ncbi:MAG: hypothetical protein U9R19_18670 [Bacteroidota bacterium]|nr:hypothetical protein [Bacteroidota bacterium]